MARWRIVGVLVRSRCIVVRAGCWWVHCGCWWVLVHVWVHVPLFAGEAICTTFAAGAGAGDSLLVLVLVILCWARLKDQQDQVLSKWSI